jgi:hypothetical protein
MQNVNDDMDALMRKAGIDYPLFTGSDDWNKVARALEIQEEPPMPRRNYGKYLGLIFLFLLPFLFTQFDKDNSNLTGNRVGVSSTSEAATLTSGAEIEKTESYISADEQNGNQKVSPVEIHANQANLENTTTLYNNKHDLAATSPQHFQPSNFAESQKNGAKKQVEKKEILADQMKESNSTSLVRVNDGLNRSGENQLTGIAKQFPGIDSSVQADHVSAAFNEPIKDVNIDSFNSASINEPVASEKTATISVSPRKKFYAGIMGGINLTTIKMQEVKEVGTDIGFIVGYQFMKRWSIEAGVLSSSKYYYSDGKYLDNPKIYLPPNAKINTIEGDCRMIEIPILIKYDFGFKKAHNWFASAGVSSFLMKKEDYAYEYYYLNTGSTYLYEHSYKNESENWAAVMQLSAGYSRALPWSLQLRMEPFIQIPLKGAGYGKLPLTSAGFRIGVTRTLF